MVQPSVNRLALFDLARSNHITNKYTIFVLFTTHIASTFYPVMDLAPPVWFDQALSKDYNPATLEVGMDQERLSQLIDSLGKHELDAIALNPGPSLYHLTGLSFHLMERPIVGLFTRDNRPALILPELEQSKAEDVGLDFDLFAYGEDETSRSKAFDKAIKHLGLTTSRIGVEPLRFRVFELQLLQAAAPDMVVVSGELTLRRLRLTKNKTEVGAIREAVRMAQAAMDATLAQVRPGMTELEIAAELTVQLLRAGSEPELPFSPIVASGPNSALPHATPTKRAIKEGELLLIDWGARVDGYISDLTRTFSIGEVDPELQKIHEIVQKANAAGREKARSKVGCNEVDDATRSVIEGEGYGENFTHRTGHGIGLETHEPPYIRADNLQPLEEGMTFTIEPGIYLPGKGGVRVEDNIVILAEGGESLSTYPRDMRSLG